ncbi:FAST kinase domain-containing protein 4 [Xylocopa sonorina]|uniref:FAST kinase domain-containing protein 4 n=1 Tax=Xylocopa sonorina TaxID=1818115 RepID=UPI00403B0AE6
MLQLNNVTVYTLATRITSRFLWRLSVSLSTNAATESVDPNVKVDQLKEAASDLLRNEHCTSFNDLKASLCSNISATNTVITEIKRAKNVHDLLEIMKIPLLSHSDILKALETIQLWVNKNNKSESSIAENVETAPDLSPLKQDIKEPTSNIEDDISQYCDLSTSEMVKEISKLARAKNRNVQLLNYFFQNIMEYNEVLNAGECSSLIYSMSTLSYSDERLLKKICSDLISLGSSFYSIPKITLISIIKSMAFVRYRNNTFLNHVCYNIINTKNKYKSKQIATILQSFAMLGYFSEHTIKIIEHYKHMLQPTMLGPSNWLSLVWSYAVFKTLSPMQIESVLNKDFITSLMFFDPKKTLSYQLKLLNINGYAQYAIDNYRGPLLDEKLIPRVVNKRSKQKESYIIALSNTLKNMLPSPSYFKTNINTGMGFLLDAELHMDSDFKPVAVTDQNLKNEKVTKIGIMVVDYYDVCLGGSEYQGLIKLYNHLLTCKKYEVLCLSYQNFGIEDKMERRVAYLKRQIWNKFNKSVE